MRKGGEGGRCRSRGTHERGEAPVRSSAGEWNWGGGGYKEGVVGRGGGRNEVCVSHGMERRGGKENGVSPVPADRNPSASYASTRGVPVLAPVSPSSAQVNHKESGGRGRRQTARRRGGKGERTKGSGGGRGTLSWCYEEGGRGGTRGRIDAIQYRSCRSSTNFYCASSTSSRTEGTRSGGPPKMDFEGNGRGRTMPGCR